MKRLATLVFNFNQDGLARAVAYDVVTLYDGSGAAVSEKVEERVLDPIADIAAVTAAVGETNRVLLAERDALIAAKDSAEKRAAEYAAELTALKLAQPIPPEA